MYNFDEIINRKGTCCEKWDGITSRNYPQDMLSMWVADMDFPVAPEITKALSDRINNHPIYGYTQPSESYKTAVCNWFKKRHNTRVEPEWIVPTPGVVCGFSMAILALTKPGDGVMIQQPVYYPFMRSIAQNDRKLVNNALVMKNGRYEMDYEDMEHKIISEQVKLFILCSPHNPVGRVWTKEELTRMACICKKHQVTIVADEIHCDFVYAPHTFTSFLSVGEAPKVDYLEHIIVCTSASKTFNLAGLQASAIFIPDSGLRKQFIQQMLSVGIEANYLFGCLGAEAAYTYGEAWFDELLAYIKGNIDFFIEYAAKELPELKVIHPEGLYLLWVDVSAFGFTDEALEHFMKYDARLWLDEGFIFGPQGSSYVRINLACPRLQVKDCIDRMKNAWKSLSK